MRLHVVVDLSLSAEREASLKGNMSYYTKIMAPSRTNDQVLEQGTEFCQAKTRAESLEIQKRNGVRYCELLRLPYYDLARMSITCRSHAYYVVGNGY